MGVQLHQLNYFSHIAGLLEAVTSQQIAALEPGDEVPKGATVVGPMPDALKAVLFLWRQAGMEHNRLVADYLTTTNGKDQDAIAAKGVAAIKKERKLYNLFWEAFKAEMGEKSVNKRQVGFGPKFEMYYADAEDDGDIGSLLDGLAVIIGGRPRY